MFGILRTLLALNIVLLHIFGVPALGNYSVHFFFVLSGFLMTYVMSENYNYDLNGFNNFWINRILRLYPIYWILLIICFLLIVFFPQAERGTMINLPLTIKDWLYNLFLIYPDRIPTRIRPKVLPSSWALTNELFFYFFISLGISKTRTRTFIWLLISAFYFVITYFYFNMDNYRYGAIAAASLPFAIGAFLYWIKDMRIFKVKLPIIFVFYGLFIINAYLFSSVNSYTKEFSIYINFILSAFIIMFLFHTKFIDSRFKKVDTYIGRYSYVLYLSHEVILILYLLISSGFGLLENSFKLKFVALVPYFCLLLVSNFVIVHTIDFKIDRLKNRFKGLEFISLSDKLK